MESKKKIKNKIIKTFRNLFKYKSIKELKKEKEYLNMLKIFNRNFMKKDYNNSKNTYAK
jgi:hypothetical protein